MSKNITTIFIDKAVNLHNNNYTYKNCVYVRATVKVTITCKIHGNFEQTPQIHLKGSGCPECAKVRTGVKNRRSNESVIKEFSIIHKNRYVYTKTNYTTSLSKVCITCREHGDFTQLAHMHLKGEGCPKCGDITRHRKRSMPYSEFIIKASIKHNNKYVYQTTPYSGLHSKIQITCGIHGVFAQKARNHLYGSGCILCKNSGGFKITQPAILYYLSINNGQAYKIGVTNRSVRKRFSGDLHKIAIVKSWEFSTGEEAYVMEQNIIKTHKLAKYVGEPLLLNGNTELFNKDILNLDTKDTNCLVLKQ